MKKVYFVLAIGVLFLLSCNSYMLYSPNPDVVETVNEKGQVQASATFGYSTTQKYGLGVNYGLTNNIAISAAAAIGQKQKYTSFAVGYFKNLNVKTFFDVYAGYNGGNGYIYQYNFRGLNSDSKIESTYNRYFLTAGIHRITNRVQLDATISAGVMDFSEFTIISEDVDRTLLNSLRTLTPIYLVQPGFRISFLDELGKLYTGLVLNPTDYRNIGIHGYNLYAGISVDLNQVLKKHKK